MPKLTYFDFPGSRGEECRLALYLAGVEFEDERIALKDWAALKPNTPYGSVPILTIEGKEHPLAQSNAILVFIGRGHDLHPKDNWRAAEHEAIMHAVGDLRGLLGPTMHMEEAQKKATREALAAEFIPNWGACIERALTRLGPGPFLDGDTIQVADLKIFMIVKWLGSGVLDHIPAEIFDDCPRMLALAKAAGEHPKIVAWYAR